MSTNPLPPTTPPVDPDENDYQVALAARRRADMRAQLLGLVLLFGLLFGSLLLLDLSATEIGFEQVDATSIAARWHEINPFFRWVPLRAMKILARLFNGATLRYTIAPLAAFLFVYFAAVRYLQDIYHLRSFRKASRFVFSALFSIFFPRVVVENGEIKYEREKSKIEPLEEDEFPLESLDDVSEDNLLDTIGGPGRLVIEPGNAIVLENLVGQSHVLRSGRFFLTRFERIGYVASLEDQKMERASVDTMSRDGIRVTVRDVRIRYRLLARDASGNPSRRGQERPFPFLFSALLNRAYDRTVNSEGEVSPWAMTVMNTVAGSISAFINEHEIDFLTAPRNSPQDPRGEIIAQLRSPAFAQRLAALGAELLWVDIGHLDITQAGVDDTRISFWQAQLHGDANVIRAAGEARKTAYRELGRAQGQADLIMSIARSLENLRDANDPQHSLSELFLVRTAQIIDSLNERNTNPPDLLNPPKGQA